MFALALYKTLDTVYSYSFVNRIQPSRTWINAIVSSQEGNGGVIYKRDWGTMSDFYLVVHVRVYYT